MRKYIFLFLLLSTPAYAGNVFNPLTGKFDIVPKVTEIDGSPSASAPTVIKVSNGALTDNGDGSVTITTGVGGGGDVSGGATSVDREVAVYSGTGGKTIQAGTSNQPTISAAGIVSVPGNIGIGTTAPVQKLEVVGAVKASSGFIGNADTATALAANPSDCSANQFASAIAASGNLTCAQPAFSDLSGSATDSQVADTITASNYLPLAGGTLTGQLISDNLGVEFDESDTNPTCAAGNFTIYADLSENKLKKCVNGSATDLDTTGGTPSFDTLTGGTNTTAAMVVGTGGSLSVTGSGTIAATSATALAANGSNCSAGSFPLGVDASGSSESCTAAALAATTITVAGTSNEISSSAGAQDLSANRTWTLSLPATIDLGGKTSFEVPNDAAPTVDAFGEIAGDNDLWAASRGAPVFYDGTAAVALVGALVSDTPSNGQVPTWNTGGTITWETPSAGSGDVTDVGNCSTGACFTGTTGTTLTSTTSEILDLGTANTLIYQRNDAGSVTFMGKDNADPADTIYDTSGAGAITVGSADVTSVTITTDGTGDGEFVVPNDSITLTTETNGNYVATVADGTGIDGTASGEGTTYTPTLDLTEVSSTTWGAGSFTTMTFDAGATDPVLTAASSALSITSANVGIGTTVPLGKLIVQGAGSTTGITFQTKDSNVTALVTMLDNGNVGIGSTLPQQKLDINGTIKTTLTGSRCVETDASGVLSVAAGACSAGGGGSSNTTIQLPIYSAKLNGAFVVFTPTGGDATTQGAQIDAGDGNWRLLFDATTDEGAMWQIRLPNNYSSTPLLKVQYSMASATSGTVEFEGAIMCVSSGDSADIGTASFSSVAVASETVPGTAGYLKELSITLNDDSCAAGDAAFLYLSTDSNDGSNDTATGDREVVNVTFAYTGS